ncbi:MAG: hypothetical protein N2235_04800 [Fischerella sp.]|nr:hypothetical protein [Fischerella sp.]
MRIIFTKHQGKQDWMERRRDDGTSTRCPMPKQGILPHDFVHYVVEDTLNLRRGFYGMMRRRSWLSQFCPTVGCWKFRDQRFN